MLRASTWVFGVCEVNQLRRAEPPCMEKSFNAIKKIVRESAVRVVLHRVQVTEHFGITGMEIKAQVVRERQLKAF